MKGACTMKMTMKRFWLRAALFALILVCMASAAAIAENISTDSAQAAVITANTKVYKSASTSSASMKVKKGTEVNLLAVKGKWALVERGGVYAYMSASQVSVKTSEPDYSSLLADAKAAVVTANTKVYKSASTSSASTWVKEGTEVNLLAVKSGWALIERGGVYAFIDAGQVQVPAAATPAPTPTATPAPDYSSLLANAKDAVLTADAKVYQSADTSSASASISKGAKVRLLAVKNGWALIERGGVYGFVKEDAVALAAAATPAPTASSDYLSSSKYSNEQKCYLFLTKEGGLNAAAACGILANIRRESNFNPTSGSSYYGLIQWGGGRLSSLKSYCSSNGYSYSSLEGQLRFLMYELKNSYPSILKYLQSVSNSASGAYYAAYHFCYYYERPANKASSSASRGELARDTYYPKYAG